MRSGFDWKSIVSGEGLYLEKNTIMRTTRGLVVIIGAILALCIVAVALTVLFLFPPQPSVETDPRFPEFHETLDNGYKVTADTALIRERFTPLGVESGVSVAASRMTRAEIPNPEAQYWYHAVLKLDENSQKKIEMLPMSNSAPMPALHPELFDDVPQECSFMRLNVEDEHKLYDIEEAIFTDSTDFRMYMNAGAYCPEKGLLLVDTWGVSGF